LTVATYKVVNSGSRNNWDITTEESSEEIETVSHARRRESKMHKFATMPATRAILRSHLQKLTLQSIM